MKNILLKIFILTALLSKGQLPYFDKYYKVGLPTLVAQNMILLKDSTYLINCIVKDSATGRQDCGFLKIDKFGNEIAKKTINYQNIMYLWQNRVCTSMQQISQSSILSFGVNYYNTNTINKIFSKINAITLDTIFNKYYSDNFHYYMYNCVKLQPNKFLLIGTKTNTSTNNYWPNYIQLDSNLSIINTFDVPYTNSLTVTDAKLNPNNKKIIMTGYKVVSINSSYSGLIETDTLGNLGNTFFNVDGMSNDIRQVFYSNYDNSYVTIGTKVTGIFGNTSIERLYICKFNANTLLPIWRKTYGTSQYVNYLYDAIINDDGSIVACGVYADSVQNMINDANANGVILKVNANGDSLWMRQYDNYQGTLMQQYDEMLKGIEKTADGGYIACGMPYYKPDSKAWVIRVDSMGCFNLNCIPSNTGVKEVNFNDGIKLYPNPVTDKLHIEVENNDATDITVCNINGQVLINHVIASGKEIDMSSLTNGVYLINLLNKKTIVSTKKIVVIK